MKKSIFKNIDFSRSYEGPLHFFKWNDMIFLRFYDYDFMIYNIFLIILHIKVLIFIPLIKVLLHPRNINPTGPESLQKLLEITLFIFSS